MWKFPTFFNSILCLLLFNFSICQVPLSAITVAQRDRCIKNIQDTVDKFKNPNLSHNQYINYVDAARRDLELVIGRKVSISECIDRILRIIKEKTNQSLTRQEIRILKNKFEHPHIYKKLGSSSSSYSDANELPTSLVYSISVCLVGLFIYTLPLPPLKQWGENLFTTGAFSSGLIIADYINKKNEEKKEKGKKNARKK